MKKILFAFLIAVSITACNNNKTADTPAGTTASSTTETKEKSPEAARGCSSFFWFKEGAVLEYQNTDATGKVTSHTTTTINKVHDDKGVLIADVTISYGTGKDIHASYRCEGDKMYVDMKSLMNDLLGSLQKTGMEVEFKNAYLSYPWTMKQGDKLDESTVEIKTKKNGKEFINMKRIVKDRTVEGNEKVTTPAGTYNCLKLTETWTLEMSMMGKVASTKNDKSVQWFDPQAGIVKTETYDEKGNLQLRSELVSLK